MWACHSSESWTVRRQLFTFRRGSLLNYTAITSFHKCPWSGWLKRAILGEEKKKISQILSLCI